MHINSHICLFLWLLKITCYTNGVNAKEVASVVAQAYNPSTQEVVAGGSVVQGQPWLNSVLETTWVIEALSQPRPPQFV